MPVLIRDNELTEKMTQFLHNSMTVSRYRFHILEVKKLQNTDEKVHTIEPQKEHLSTPYKSTIAWMAACSGGYGFPIFILLAFFSAASIWAFLRFHHANKPAQLAPVRMKMFTGIPLRRENK